MPAVLDEPQGKVFQDVDKQPPFRISASAAAPEGLISWSADAIHSKPVKIVVSADGKRKCDVTELPHLAPTIEVYEQWTDGTHDNVYQVEGVLVSEKYIDVSSFQMDFEPAGCVIDCWNLKSRGTAGSWEPSDFYQEIGRVIPGTNLPWGGLFTTDEFKLTFRPKKALP